ncbi:MAG: ATP-dependent sacrificial sulfur transferase LarE [Methanobacterium sp.]|uniref:ATP-dependent sacrificial sulfur transferase LarE n=1 Tax=Methanobacterium sp. TaxID=2164 RepID=UPI003D655DA9|nr:ATP-dependent sacrificial sulfur transferase LarE [Methanobacterium sp.]
MNLEQKIEKLKEYLKDKRVLVAFSGGADSTLIAKFAKDVCKEAVAVTVDNGVLPADCISNAQEIAMKIGIFHEVIHENFIENEAFKSNQPNRCFICKNIMYSKLQDAAKEKGFDIIIDGTNISDLLEDRPGIAVNYEKNIISPLVYAGFTGDDVRTALEKFNITYSTSTTCFASRIARYNKITSKKINRISYAESLIKNMVNEGPVRVRDENGIARIEVDDVAKLLNMGVLNHINSELKAVGFRRVALDITGYGEPEKDLVIYKPCKDEANKIMFETELPYEVDIKNTCIQLENLGSPKCSDEMGLTMLEVDGKNVTIFRSGKVVARRVRDKEDAEALLIEVLPLIRRKLV